MISIGDKNMLKILFLLGLSLYIRPCIFENPGLEDIFKDKAINKTAPIFKSIKSQLNKPYNEFTQLMTHNSTSLRKNKILGILHNLVADQHHSLKEQLETGVRAFKLPIHLYNDQAWISHTLDKDSISRFFSKWAILKKFEDKMLAWHHKIDRSHQSLTAILSDLKDWLEKNPKEIITLNLDTFTHGDKVAQSFQESGIDKHIFVKSCEKWPTLQEILEENKRLIVFMDTKISEQLKEKYQWARGIHYLWDHAVENKFRFKKKSDLYKDDCTPNRGRFENDIFLMNHFTTGLVSGRSKDAKTLNKSEQIIEHMLRCQEKFNKKPTWIMVDFYDFRVYQNQQEHQK